jgi:hypothetical protein
MTASAASAQVRVRHMEGTVHGFLVLRTLDGKVIANGDLTQVPKGNQLTSKIVFHFHDGSLHQETAVYRQRGIFRLLSYKLEQRGPSFKTPLEMSIDTATNQVIVRYEQDGKEQVKFEHMDLPQDLANGISSTLLKNLRPEDGAIKLSYVAATPKPRLVKLNVFSHGEDTFAIDGGHRKAIHWVVKIELGGVAGVVAPVLGKEPPDIHVWILQGEAPAFVREEGPMSNEGPVWRIELASPKWGGS